MESKFKPGDRVYHRNLKQYGIFVGYAWESDEECDVDFEMEDGEIEQKHVSINWLELACEHRRNDGICLNGASSSGKCIYPTCSHYKICS